MSEQIQQNLPLLNHFGASDDDDAVAAVAEDVLVLVWADIDAAVAAADEASCGRDAGTDELGRDVGSGTLHDIHVLSEIQP